MARWGGRWEGGSEGRPAGACARGRPRAGPGALPQPFHPPTPPTTLEGYWRAWAPAQQTQGDGPDGRGRPARAPSGLTISPRSLRPPRPPTPNPAAVPHKYGELGMKTKYGHEQASRARRLAVTIGKRAKATWISHPASRRRGACVGGSLVPPRVKAPRPTQASLAAPHAFSSECGRKPAALPTSIFNPHRARARACHVLRAKNLHGRCKRRRGRLFRHRGRGMRPRRCCGAGRSGRHWRLAGVCTVLRRRARTMRSNAISRATHGAAAVDRKLMTQL